MKTIFTKLDQRQKEIAKPIYISTAQFRDAYYIPEEDRSRIIIVDFKEEEDETQGS
jgi:hypothetical protein